MMQHVLLVQEGGGEPNQESQYFRFGDLDSCSSVTK
jgi:hypothetical protein